MSKEKLQADYANTLLKYKPGKGWSPIDYTRVDEPDVSPAQAPAQRTKPTPNVAKAAKVIPLNKGGAENVAPNGDHASLASAAGNDASVYIHTEQAQLDSWLEQAALSPDHFALDDMAGASLETLSQRLPELFVPLDQFADEAGVLSWEDVARGIASLEATMQERARLMARLAQADEQIAAFKRELKLQLHDIQRQERAKAAAAQLRERLSAHTAQAVSKRLRQLLDE